MTQPTNRFKHVILHLGTAKREARQLAEYELASQIHEIIEDLWPKCPACGHLLEQSKQ